ncbi:uncharacterized protein LOC123588990 isoform X1 [Leopardus geoffroyi]|uniref:uncharacterized protein LOC123588990 isoform X1 n=1 Tax=Leopardus geoffroyi TaxID=46844 RepID=UPI001E25D486|nr:uncharacterized protein LOC123588990 isoform X1 [Leopardus geoffroyi]
MLGPASPRRDPEGGGMETRGANATCWENAPPPRPPPLVLESLISWQPGCRTSADTKGFIATVSLSRSEEFLTQISTELTDEALFTAGYGTNPVPTKDKQTQDRGTQISKHVFFQTRGTDTRSDRNRTRTKTHLLPSPRDKNVHQSSSFTSH